MQIWECYENFICPTFYRKKSVASKNIKMTIEYQPISAGEISQHKNVNLSLKFDTSFNHRF